MAGISQQNVILNRIYTDGSEKRDKNRLPRETRRGIRGPPAGCGLRAPGGEEGNGRDTKPRRLRLLAVKDGSARELDAPFSQ